MGDFVMTIVRIGSWITHAGSVLVIAGLSLGAVADAQAFEVTEAQKEACTPDAFRLCSAEIPDANRVAACMAAKQSQLSAPCRAVFVSFNGRTPHRAAAYVHHHRWHHYARERELARHRTFARYEGEYDAR